MSMVSSGLRQNPLEHQLIPLRDLSDAAVKKLPRRVLVTVALRDSGVSRQALLDLIQMLNPVWNEIVRRQGELLPDDGAQGIAARFLKREELQYVQHRFFERVLVELATTQNVADIGALQIEAERQAAASLAAQVLSIRLQAHNCME
jgi:hypothetical protein